MTRSHLDISTKLREFLTHDGIVEAVSHDLHAASLIIEMELPEESPEEIGRRGKFIFHNVPRLETNRPLAEIDWQTVGADLLTLRYTPENDADNLKGVTCVIWLEYNTGDTSELIIEFVAGAFSWIACSH